MSRIAIVGEGQLADRVADLLEEHGPLTRLVGLEAGVPVEAELILALRDDWNPDEAEAVERRLRNAGSSWLGAYVSFDEGIIGPFVDPKKPGCSECANARRLIGGHDFRGNLEPLMSLVTQGFVPRDPGISDRAVVQMSLIVAREALSVLNGGSTRTVNGIYVLDLKSLECSLHPFLPNPLCPYCGRTPPDTSEAARIELKPSPKEDAESNRARKLTRSVGEALIKRYVDKRTGLLREMWTEEEPPFAMVGVTQHTPLGAEHSGGRGHSYLRCGFTAVLEGLERYCGMTARAKRISVTGSYRELADRALDPRSVGLYDKDRYDSPDFEFVPFDDDLVLNWVWGYSLVRNAPVLVPESLAYYNPSDATRFVSEGSNGCALGGSLEEAILHGILEVTERDSFLMAWHARLPLPRLDPDSARDRELSHMINRLRELEGYEVLLYNSTLENRIPSLIAILKNAKQSGANLICAAGADLDPVRAAKSAVLEAAGHIRFLSARLEQDREDIEPMLTDPERVVQMEDHPLLYSLPQAEDRLAFLLDSSRKPRRFDEEFEPVVRSADLTEDLERLLGVFRELGLDVVAVDQTAPELTDEGLFVVKTIIPGMLPMTFGHSFRRRVGLERLFRIPMELGYSDRSLTVDRLNPHPHPFF
ncbi:TOMM precursor leader peptide-binding protein [Cohnella sp. AR92]|uniref:TOMM precursor leader peptide-binding protein n=1 Tax=Cohnella sp. AR92 TaxID=648716 RepID=UPI000F8F1610|nr:TOMM precursor leader peptide-binding protein [Cohnella sp. AR92]RUS43888.1 bacteriocin biosynthesis protein SagD [Cohnella sp. AR92]